MKLTIDVGNTNIVCGIWNQDQLTWSQRFETNKTQIEQMSQALNKDISQVVIGSVVPELNNDLETSLSACVPAQNIQFVDYKDLHNLNYQVPHPNKVGIDRLINAFTALQLHPNTAVVCIDMGTATTIDLLNKAGEFCGGVICPGPKTYLDSVVKKSSQIQGMDFKKPDHVLGKNTQECLQAGLFYGYPAMIEGIVSEIASQQNLTEYKVILTGGLGNLFLDHFKIGLIYDEWHTLKGLNLIRHCEEQSDVAISNDKTP